MKNKKGFTLIELVITLAILGIVLPMIFSPLIFSFTNFIPQNEKTKITSDARDTMDYLTREIRKSDQVMVAGNTITIDSVVYEVIDRRLTKDHGTIGRGIDQLVIDELLVNQVDEEIKIEIVIKDSKGKKHNLSSTIHIR